MRLFVAVLCHAEFGHVNVWQSSVLPYHAKILHSGEAHVNFFTYNEKMKVELEGHGLETVYGPRDLDVETPYPPRIYVDDPREFNASFWRDYQIAAFRYALANYDFRIFVKGEIDSVFCIETLARRVDGPRRGALRRVGLGPGLETRLLGPPAARVPVCGVVIEVVAGGFEWNDGRV